MTPLFLGMAGTTLSDVERGFFRDLDPAGYILFKRNVADRAQLRALTDALREIAGRDDLPILIDQEGGRVARMQPPEWPAFPKAELFDRLYDIAPMTAIEAARHNARAIAATLAEVGITVDCLPLLDVRQPGAHDIIGDRALGAEPMRVAAMGRAVIEGLRDGGVVGVVKHIPGHGRAMADSHVELPVVEADDDALETDLEPFAALNDAPMAMTAHVVYPAWDGEQCASLSAKVIGGIIRGRIGFDGLLMSDDLGMHALTGDFGERAAGVLAAGCDIALHCSGDMAEMEAIAAAVGAIDELAKARLDRAMATVAGARPDRSAEESIAKRDALMAVLPA
ncbi:MULTISPECIES: beta-N-acetylhexosaminidase [unclassified Sphingomonas]|uniref:beta-N-acetylhexosaminidase n=1 Tax=unclassified Sphingomonas TaxID=196159 RepID=UPI0006FC6BC0|nr:MULTISPECIES: beta-N-acetylhexosaminidase [unclassified Sphingomonas]KQX17819.1 beta-hexosaminidase [Sphingomonas sp. Root1294]KQY70745.1 beta-hexosaminidase [Sphingomonas sp. Root50]KRB91762.1 beta-hexosaminidase [Sphingomonas sp. Root720]